MNCDPAKEKYKARAAASASPPTSATSSTKVASAAASQNSEAERFIRERYLHAAPPPSRPLFHPQLHPFVGVGAGHPSNSWLQHHEALRQSSALLTPDTPDTDSLAYRHLRPGGGASSEGGSGPALPYPLPLFGHHHHHQLLHRPPSFATPSKYNATPVTPFTPPGGRGEIGLEKAQRPNPHAPPPPPQHQPPFRRSPMSSVTDTDLKQKEPRPRPPRSPEQAKAWKTIVRPEANINQALPSLNEQQQQRARNFSGGGGDLAASKQQPPQSTTVLSHFNLGSLIQLSNGDLKKVEDLSTEDFVKSADFSSEVKIDHSTVTSLDANLTTGTVTIAFSVGKSHVQVAVEATLEHPFFVFGKGWASSNPEITMSKYHLPCQQLKVGDVCISLTATASAASAATSNNSRSNGVGSNSEVMMPPPPPTDERRRSNSASPNSDKVLRRSSPNKSSMSPLARMKATPSPVKQVAFSDQIVTIKDKTSEETSDNNKDNDNGTTIEGNANQPGANNSKSLKREELVEPEMVPHHKKLRVAASSEEEEKLPEKS